MSFFKYTFAIILYCFNSLPLFSQDTVFLKSGFKLIVIVKEINAREIKYFRCNKPKGLSYFEDIKNISTIHYLSGQKDTIMQLKEEPSRTLVNDNKLYMTASIMTYNSKKLKDKKLFALINSYPLEITKNQLLVDFAEIKKIKKKRVLWGVFTIIFGSLTFESPALLWQGFGPKPPIVYIIPAVFAVSFGTSIAIFRKYRKKETLKRVELSNRYNEDV